MPSSPPRRTQSLAARLQTKLLDADLAALGTVPVGVATVAPHVTTPEQRLALADDVLGVIGRAGLAAQFRMLAVPDAVAGGDAWLADLLGAKLVHDRTPAGPLSAGQPVGVPTGHPDDCARRSRGAGARRARRRGRGTPARAA